MKVKGLLLHHDNATFHIAILTVKISILAIEKLQCRKERQNSLYTPYCPTFAMYYFWRFANLEKNLLSRRFPFLDEIEEAIKETFHRFQEIDGIKHIIVRKLAYKISLMLEGITWNTPKIELV